MIPNLFSSEIVPFYVITGGLAYLRMACFFSSVFQNCLQRKPRLLTCQKHMFIVISVFWCAIRFFIQVIIYTQRLRFFYIFAGSSEFVYKWS
jgi:hypothetical protein